MVSNKTRGKYFEETISEKLRNYFGYSKLDIHRNQNSGNFSTEFGDIQLPFDCIVECKYQKSWDYIHLLKGNATIDNWLSQLDESYNKYKIVYKREPIKLLIISKPYEKIIAFININPSKYTDIYLVYKDMFVLTFEKALEVLRGELSKND